MKKGFTLIELLAVIVILAIIAVIAVPIVINIIDDSKKNASLRSAEMYMDAVEMGVAQATLKGQSIQKGVYYIMNDGNICLKNYNKETKQCTDTDNIDDNEILKVEVKGETPKEGTITIKDGNISNVDFEVSENRVIKNDKGEIIYFPCTLISGEENEIGSKYECEVKSGTKYNFYVLSYNDVNNESTNDKNKAVTTNLIMDSNINKKGEAIKSNNISDKGYVAWMSNLDYGCGDDENCIALPDKGPVTAMNYLNEVTKTWSNILNLNLKYKDEGNRFGEISITGKARMPYKSEVSNYSESSNNGYLYEFMAPPEDCGEGAKSINNVSNILGYWTLSSGGGGAYFMNCIYEISDITVFIGLGVRPVINIKL